ncbi:MAG: hypothetical protein V2J24_16470 [Pseudomonadales bacterium]|jgi:hypothetical protein|nr:hypothetical protein [Pseudomonadales bacterium]
MQRLWETILGIWAMARLAWLTRLRFGGPYWQWRLETAFGSDRRRWPPRRQRLAALIEYARWAGRMRQRL